MNEQALFGNVGYSLLICFEMFKGKQVKTLLKNHFSGSSKIGKTQGLMLSSTYGVRQAIAREKEGFRELQP